jgi:hypothetical protein
MRTFADLNTKLAVLGLHAARASVQTQGGDLDEYEPADINAELVGLIESIYHAIRKNGYDPEEARNTAWNNYLYGIEGEAEEVNTRRGETA